MAKKILVIVGSLSKDSINRKLAKALVALAPAGMAFEFAELGDLPVYNRDDDANQPPAAKRLKAQIEAADGVMFVTPEYNRSIPASLKNVIDHASRPSGQSSWFGRAGAIIGTSPGGVGTALAQQHLRTILSAQGVRVMPQPDAYIQFKDGLITDDGQIGEASRAFLQKWMDAFVQWVEKLA